MLLTKVSARKDGSAPPRRRCLDTAAFLVSRLGRKRIPHRLTPMLLVCTAFSLSSDLASQTPNPPVPPLGNILDVGGYGVHVYCAGSGSPAVMIVGAAFSFDWDLVQSAAAKFTQVCTFDPSGSVLSDPFEAAVRAVDPGGSRRFLPTCGDRAEEIHRVVVHAPIQHPYILVGYSVGALWERLFAGRYPAGIGGIVIIDHAFLPRTKRSRQGERPLPLREKIGDLFSSLSPLW